ncbi:MAG: hypothetical protein R3321_00345 [Nitrososphaeraceae archaeon]|nr:hypothetical protein [Nitrososphaeraceae archaeon]
MYIDDTYKLNPSLRALYETAIDLFLLAVGQYPTGNFTINRKGVRIFRNFTESGLDEGVLFPNGSSVRYSHNTLYINEEEIDYYC